MAVLTRSLITDDKNFPEGFKGHDKVLCHLSKSEAKSFDIIQGGADIDHEDLPIRTYVNKFGKMILNPEFRDYYLTVTAYEVADDKPKVEILDHQREAGEEVVHQTKWQPAPGDGIPQVKKLAEMGRGKGKYHDSIMCYMPSNMIYLLGLANGEVRLNPKTGSPQFGFWHEAGRIGATVVGGVAGFMMGGPMGAMAGAAAGSALGSAITGRKPKDWLPQAGKAAAATGAVLTAAPYVPGLGALGTSMAASGLPGLAHLGNAMGQMASAPGIFSQLGLTGAGAMSAPNAPAAGYSQPWGQLTATTQAGTTPSGGLAPVQGGGQNPLASLFSSGQQGGGGGMNFMGQALPLAMQAYGIMQGPRLEKEHYRLEMEARNKMLEEQRKHEDDLMRRAGFFDDIKESKVKRVPNPRFGMYPGESPYMYGEPHELNREGIHHHFAKGGYVKPVVQVHDFPQDHGDLKVRQTGPWEFVEEKKGGKPPIQHGMKLKKGILLEGPGKGQDDTIHDQDKEGTYIIDASTMGMLGDGSNEAGAEVLQDFLDSKLAETDPHCLSLLMEDEQKARKVPIAYSRGEGRIRPAYVMALGDGNHAHGVRMLNRFVQEIRQHKASRGQKLPPKAKPIEQYMKAA